MDKNTVGSLQRGSLLYRVADADGDPHVVEWRFDFPPIDYVDDESKCSPRTIRIARTKYFGRVLPQGHGAVERVSVNDLLSEFALTPGEAAALYVQAKVQAELQAQAKLRAATEAARTWFAAWYMNREVW